MEKEKVLEIEIVKVNEEYSSWYISYQNEEVLKREIFLDNELNITSISGPDYYGGRLYLRGYRTGLDKKANVIKNEEVEELINKVNAVNEKYGVVKRWRADDGKIYHYINSDGRIISEQDYYHNVDNSRYSLDNYFKTEEEAEIYLEKIKKILKERE